MDKFTKIIIHFMFVVVFFMAITIGIYMYREYYISSPIGVIMYSVVVSTYFGMYIGGMMEKYHQGKK